MSEPPKVYEQDLTEFKADPANPNKGNKRGRAVLDSSIKELGAGRSIVADKDGTIVAGNKTRDALIAAGHTKAVIVEVSGDTPVVVKRTDMDMEDPTGTARRYAFTDNRVGQLSLTWDDDQILKGIQAGMDLSQLWDTTELEAVQGDHNEQTKTNEREQTRVASANKLQEKFIVPPFTVLDARQGYWQDRKRAWYGLGIEPGAGRDHLNATSNNSAASGKYEYMTGRGGSTGGSNYDPVLAELVCRWFCLPGGSLLDPFAGGPTLGIVSAKLGYAYTGVELRPAQVQANQDQADFVGVAPTWIQGDSANLEEVLPAGEQYDLLFTDPPYYDLEIYSGHEKDGSAFTDYATFIVWYAAIIKAACARLKDDRFAVVKVGVMRDKKTHAYYDFVGDNVRAFQAAGLIFYNEAVLLTPIGTMPIRASMHFPSGRKLEKGHQNVLVFYKGSIKAIKANFGAVEVQHGLLTVPDSPPAE